MSKKVTTETVDTNSLVVKKTAKGNYTWEIKIYKDNLSKAVEASTVIDAQLKLKYNGVPA